ncbi:MAG: toll/interleukin-1 receptor domain-containing protein [Steroidobacteraceae bacterium]
MESRLPGIFISYRRNDNPDATGRIYDRLVAEFGKARVFKDVDSIPLGQDFRGHLNSIVGECWAVLAIIGPRWTDASNKAGQRRLEDPDDFVRIELEAALARDIPVVPVLVAHAPLPVASELPGSLAPMAFRQSIEVRPDPDFHNDATRLVTSLRGILTRRRQSKWLPRSPRLPQRQECKGVDDWAGSLPLCWASPPPCSLFPQSVICARHRCPKHASTSLRPPPTIRHCLRSHPMAGRSYSSQRATGQHACG